MKYLLLFSLALYFSSCNSNKTKVNIKNKLTTKDSAHYSNGQLAYIKENNTVKFYNYKGRLKKILDLNTRIEKDYNLICETFEFETGRDYHINMGNGYHCYPDAEIIPKGTQKHIGDVGIAVSDKDELNTFSKNNLGYPSALKLNAFGQITEDAVEKRTFDDLGRITQRNIYSGNSKTPYKTIEYVYDNANLKSAIHTGDNKEDNYNIDYFFDRNDNIAKEIKKQDNKILSIAFYGFEENLIQFKETYSQSNNDPIVIDNNKL